MIADSFLRALPMSLAMGWDILWPLILGFALSAAVQAAVSHREMSRLLPDEQCCRPAPDQTASDRVGRLSVRAPLRAQSGFSSHSEVS